MSERYHSVAGCLRGLEFCLGDVKLLAAAAVAAAAEFLSGAQVESNERPATECLSGGKLRWQRSVKDNHARVRSCLCFSPPLLCLQHVLILVKLILRILIPDEPAWICKKREHIEFMSMQALKQQVCFQTFTFKIFRYFSEAEELYICLLEAAVERFLTAFQGLGCRFTLSCVENCYNQKIEDRSTNFSVYCFRGK